MADKYSIMRNAYKKLDQLPLGFGLPQYADDIPDATVEKYFGIDLLDATRSMKIVDTTAISTNTIDEMMVENRVVYFALRRYRNTSAAYFKFSTAVDGKTVDKTKIPSTLSDIIKEYDDEYKKWKGSTARSLWNRGE